MVKKSEAKRFRKPDQNYVEQAIQLDLKWRKLRFELDQIAKQFNKINKEIGKKNKAKESFDAEKAEAEKLKVSRDKLESEEKELFAILQSKVKLIGNIVHESVPISDNEDNNFVVRTWGEIPQIKVDSTIGHAHHNEILAMIDGYDPKRGAKVSGHRGYFLKNMGVMLNMALVNYGLNFLTQRGYTAIQTPYFMKKNVMAETCQLSDFDEQLYKVTGSSGNDDPDSEFYLIATSEQPISAFFHEETVDCQDLPIRFGGYSSCFRKEAGAHGKDAWGIFRVHQFEKIEQFVITSPEESWNEHERMIKLSEEFY